MGRKEDGLMLGTYIFIGVFVVAALLIGEYASWTSKDRSASHANRT